MLHIYWLQVLVVLLLLGMVHVGRSPPPPPPPPPLLLLPSGGLHGGRDHRQHQHLVILSELCHYPDSALANVSLFRDYPQLGVLPATSVCDDGVGGDGSILLQTIAVARSRGGTGHLVGSVEPSLCSAANLMAAFHNATLHTWNCPQDDNIEDLWSSRGQNLGAAIPYTAAAITQLTNYMKWKSIAIVSTNLGWWPTLAQRIDIQLREGAGAGAGANIIPRHFIILPDASTQEFIYMKLKRLKRTSCRAIILCVPANDLGILILQVIDELELALAFETLTVLVDVASLPSWIQHLQGTWLTTTNNTSSNTNSKSILKPTLSSSSVTSLFRNLSSTTRKYVLFFTEASKFNATLEQFIMLKVDMWSKLLESQFTQRIRDNDVLMLLDLKDDDSFRDLLRIHGDNTSDGAIVISKDLDNLDEWRLKHIQNEECEYCYGELTNLYSVLVILVCSSTFVALLFGTVICARYQLMKKRVNKGPYKVILTATDFVFPQLADSRRVDEGIEAMLCCWLQQLQEFGGPEVDKPDLLQGSGDNNTARTPLRGGSSPNLIKQLIVDPRVRYNGDLVQMKPISTGSSAELKSKAVEVLVVLHGLRQENINPLIGCLAEPPRAALVSEWCARGSLQDVLQQDDIKLDWSFRLSLLTDLVRGMKYLHSTPVRVHGNLTSRNCVIDARWVLKVTDYGLPAFYEAQGIPVAEKTARELLWTSPELLRNANLRKKGTQQGDVYSFGIILQEVVVRGEPFCMLALTPEEIIGKVKKPPPLIRPSVSKGAAPPEAINIMRQCWAEQAEMRPDFVAVNDQFKKLNHGRKVNIVDTMFQMLEKYSNNLEELIRERTEQLDMEKKKTEQLLNRMLPSSVAEQLKLGKRVDPEEFAEVTIYFSDIVGFTTISAHSTPFQVVDLLNDLYTCFDATINAYSVYKVETIGDAYMCVGGLPVRVPDHAEQVATMALDLLHQSGKFRIRHLPGTPLRLRIGLHTGPCCAGVVGLTMPRYCLFGDTVNTASRMESSGSAWRIHLSETTKERLEKAGGYELEYRGLTDIKGKGAMPTYWLLGKAGFDKALPVPPSLELQDSLIVCRSDFEYNQIGTGDGSSSPHHIQHHHYHRPSATFDVVTAAADAANATAVNNTYGGLLHLEELGHLIRLPGFEDQRAPDTQRPMHHDPSFMKLMECSKFSSLLRSQDTTAGQIMTSPVSGRGGTTTNKALTTSTSATKSMNSSHSTIVKSISSDNPAAIAMGMISALGTPVSANDVAAALMGASTSSLSGFRGRHTHKRIEEEDLSTPYNHYKCLSPKDKLNKSLRRQFSLDRAEEIAADAAHFSPVRLCKQNSAGAADLEKIEEASVTSTKSPSTISTLQCTLSISVDSLIH